MIIVVTQTRKIKFIERINSLRVSTSPKILTLNQKKSKCAA